MTQPAGHGKSHQRRGSVRHRASARQQCVPATNPAPPTGAAITEVVRQGVGEQNYRHWFHQRARLEVTNEQLLVHVANPFICSWMMKRFRQQLTAAAVELLGPSAGFVVHVDTDLSDSATASASETDAGTATEAASAAPQSSDSSTAVTGTSSPASRHSGPAPAADNQHRSNPLRSSHSTRSSDPAALITRPPARRRFRTFRSFVSGPCNELSLMASRQVTEAPGERFNPLFLHGPTGVGKSHLLESIYSEIRRNHPELNTLFLTSESFTNYFTAALTSGSVPSFRQRFRSVDVLLVDNIEFLSNKKATQEEFLHTIDQLIDHGGQLVLTCDRHPRLLTKHREELTTRFVGGLVCRIDRPAESTRQKLVESLTLPHQQHLSKGAMNLLVRHGGRNARELQGSVNSLVSHATLRNERVTSRVARGLLGDLREECRHLVRICDVERIVCEAFGISVKDLRSKTRRKAISCPRSVAMYVARRLTKAAWREIGQYFGGRDHSTVVAASKRVDDWIARSVAVELPNSCRGTTWNDVVQELEERILAAAS